MMDNWSAAARCEKCREGVTVKRRMRELGGDLEVMELSVSQLR
jgi:hypothetical protein